MDELGDMQSASFDRRWFARFGHVCRIASELCGEIDVHEDSMENDTLASQKHGPTTRRQGFEADDQDRVC